MEPKARKKRAHKQTWKRERQRAQGFYICFSIFYLFLREEVCLVL